LTVDNNLLENKFPNAGLSIRVVPGNFTHLVLKWLLPYWYLLILKNVVSDIHEKCSNFN
jgi:hypothetical protein